MRLYYYSAMSTILYYSNYCQNCKQVLGVVSRSPVKDEMHFLCVDDRIKGNNGATYIKLQDGQQVILPPTVTRVPALLLLNRGHHVLFGEEIMKHIQPSVDVMKQKAVKQSGEPMAFSLGGGSFGVASDSYSFLDMSSDDLAAKGNGGMRQQHMYAGVGHADQIETPPDNYSPDTIGNGGVSMEQLQASRASEVRMKEGPPPGGINGR